TDRLGACQRLLRCHPPHRMQPLPPSTDYQEHHTEADHKRTPQECAYLSKMTIVSHHSFLLFHSSYAPGADPLGLLLRLSGKRLREPGGARVMPELFKVSTLKLSSV